MFRPASYAAVLLAVVFGSSSIGHAQGRFGGSGNSAFGNSGFGSSGFGNSGFGGNQFGGGGFGGGGSGNSGFGNSGFGNAGFGASRFSGSAIGNQFNTGGFGAGSYSGGQNFIGRDSGDMAATFTQMGQAGTQFFNQMNRNSARENRDRQSTPTVENPPQPVRVELQVAFTAPSPSPVVVENNLRARLGKILAEHNIAAPQVAMEGDTAVLAGTAATESQRLVLEKLISLEPGVRQVRNEMIVIEPPAALPTAPPGN